MEERDMNGDSRPPERDFSYNQKRVEAEYEKARQIAYEDQHKYDSEKRKAERDAYRHKAEEFTKLTSNMSQLDPQSLEYLKNSLGIPGNQIAGAQPYQPLGGFGGLNAADGTTLRKTMEDAAEFSRSPFSKDSVALEEFGKTGRKPKCIFMSATNGHNLELFELDGYMWVRNTDDDGNMMQVRLGFSERQRMKESM